jgi:microcystin-dependent protein
MGDPYIGEIRMFAGNFAPAGWANCDGQLMPISENEALFQLIGTTYGGDGQETFGLPNLQGRVPIHVGQGPGLSSRVLGEVGGVETVTLTQPQLAAHTHQFIATQNPGTSPNPANDIVAQPAFSVFVEDVPLTTLAPNVIQPVGGSQPHENRQPYLTVRFVISLFGIYPPQ